MKLNRVILIPDSFKGTLSSAQICALAADCIRARFPACAVDSIPVADGGEGSVDCFLEAVPGGEKRFLTCSGPFGEPVEGFYGVLPNGTAVLEMAACAALPLAERLAAPGRTDPARTTTYGVGELLLRAAEDGCKTLLLGLGGSATNDGGCGAAAAAGVKFYDADGNAFVPVGGTLKNIVRIDASELAPALRDAEITVLCDVRNPLYGPTGAAAVFAPQKGADEAMVAELDEGLRHLAARIREDLGVDVSELPGGGAAGGMGAGMAAFFGAALRPGIEVVLDTADFDRRAAGADLVITGEGKLDSQSLQGKVLCGVGQRAKALGVPAIALVGGAAPDIAPIYDLGISAVFPINRRPEDFSVSRHLSIPNFTATLQDVLRLIEVL